MWNSFTHSKFPMPHSTIRIASLLRSGLFRHHRMRLGADALDRAHGGVSGPHPARIRTLDVRARGAAAGYHVSWTQRKNIGCVVEQLVDVVAHPAGVGILHHL